VFDVRLNVTMRYLASVLLVCLWMVVPSAQTAPPSAGDQPRFDVASVKPNPGADASGGMRLSPGRVTFIAHPLIEVIAYANRNERGGRRFARILGAPDWVGRERFDITATFTPGATPAAVAAMLRMLLAERFTFRAHSETRPLQTYVLLKDRGDGRLGPGMRQSSADCKAVRCSVRNTPRGSYQATGADWPEPILLGELGRAVGTLVVDRTGLTGQYNIDLEWAEPNTIGAGQAAAIDRPSVFTAVREQLGLKLEPRTESMEVLVIDSIERPTPD
jgi:uncharacterized protein (TIGR03435 family)